MTTRSLFYILPSSFITEAVVTQSYLYFFIIHLNNIKVAFTSTRHRSAASRESIHWWRTWRDSYPKPPGSLPCSQ